MSVPGYRTKVYQFKYLDYCQEKCRLASCFTYRLLSTRLFDDLSLNNCWGCSIPCGRLKILIAAIIIHGDHGARIQIRRRVLSLNQIFSPVAGKMFNIEQNIDPQSPYVNLRVRDADEKKRRSFFRQPFTVLTDQ